MDNRILHRQGTGIVDRALVEPPSDTNTAGVRVVAVVVTHDRPALLWRCLEAIGAQSRQPASVVVLDNGSGQATGRVIAQFAFATHVRLPVNLGGAFGFRAGISSALEGECDFIWTMDDDGMPGDAECLERLVQSAVRIGADIAGPLTIDIDDPGRLAFPLRASGKMLHAVGEIKADGPILGFAHLFNGALIRKQLFRAIGLPNPTLMMRGDEVEFLYRARQFGARVILDPMARFRHPGSSAELKPMLGGRYYAVLPSNPLKRRYTFRNRGYIFARYGLWPHLTADALRYAWFFLVTRHGDLAGLREWCVLTLAGVGLRHAVDLPELDTPVLATKVLAGAALAR